MRAILASGLVEHVGKQTTVVGGVRCIASLRKEFAGRGFDFLSLSATDTTACIRSAAIVLTAPGLTSTLECFRSCATTFFLPPQNYSQWSVLRQLRQRSLAPLALDWHEICPSLKLRDRLTESERKPLVQAALKHMTETDDASRELAARLARIRLVECDHLVSEQGRFFRGLGRNGSVTIAIQLRSIAAASTAVEFNRVIGKLPANPSKGCRA